MNQFYTTTIAMDAKLLNATSLPLYLQLSEFLIREIAAGRLSDGDKLPPEREMAAQYKTTVTTLRKALAVLQNKGLLERIHGSGNYVRQAEQVDSVYSMFRLELVNGGGLPTSKLVELREMSKPVDLPAFGLSEMATRIRRLRFLDAKLIAVEEIWLDRDAGEVKQEQLQDSLYRYYKMQLGFWISRAEDRVSIGRTPDWSPQDFGVAAGQSTGFIERFSWAQTPVPVEYSRTWFDTTKAVYIQRLH